MIHRLEHLSSFAEHPSSGSSTLRPALSLASGSIPTAVSIQLKLLCEILILVSLTGRPRVYSVKSGSGLYLTGDIAALRSQLGNPSDFTQVVSATPRLPDYHS